MPRPKKDITVYVENPFLKNFSVSAKRKKVTVSANRAIIDTTTGEVEDVAEIVQVQMIDDAQFVKVYTSELKSLFDLTPSTYKILQVVLHQLQSVPNSDTIMLDMLAVEAYFKETEQSAPSPATFHRSIKEMIKKNFIAQTQRPGHYFINPALFFNGDRFKFVREYRRNRVTSRPVEKIEKSDDQMSLL